jgi:hypothetical protein
MSNVIQFESLETIHQIMDKRMGVLSQAFDWGQNCQVLGFSVEQTRQIIDGWSILDQDILDCFWDGYHQLKERDYVIQIHNCP